MTVSAESYESAAIQIACTMLAACARFQDRSGAATPTLALGKIVESYSGNSAHNGGALGTGTASNGEPLDLNVPFYAIVGLPDGVQSSAGGVAYDDRDFAIGIRLVHHRTMDGETAPDGSRRVLNDAGMIRQQLEAQRGGPPAFLDYEVSSSGLFIDEDGGVHRDHIITELTITVRG